MLSCPIPDVAFNVPIGSRTTYRVGGAALAHATVGSHADLGLLVTAAAANQVPTLLMGKGSNMLVADRGFWGIAISLTGDFEAIDIDNTSITAGAAVSLPALARRSVAEGLTGFEWAVGVPGSVGGGVVMNAGGHGSDMAASVTEATVLDSTTGELRTMRAQQLSFGYRTSAIDPRSVVLSATLALAPGERTQGETTLSEIVQWRRQNQPGGQNAGSVFTNPSGDSAGRLIDAVGGKGLRVGTAQVSDKHANFIQADQDGSADDVWALMQRVQELVRNEMGIELEPETRLVGFA